MADARAREQLRQERAAFEQAHRHDKAWFRLRLAMGYLGLTFMLAIFAMAFWVLAHPAIYGPLPLGAAAITMTGQALALSFGIARLVLLQANAVRLDPLTVENANSTPPPRRAATKRKPASHSRPAKD
jgi:hypothetical protein